MTAAIDITAAQRKMLLALLRHFIRGVVVWAYGSRVKWTARTNSDLDLVAFSAPAQRSAVSELKDALAESDLPFLVDLHIWDDVPARFQEIIRKEYVVVQEAEEKQSIPEGRVRLRDVCVKIGSGATPRGGKKAYKGGATSLIRSQNIYNEGFHRDGLVYIDDDQSAELRNVDVKPNDVLLNITGDSVARCCQVAQDVLPARVNQHVAIIRPQPKSLDARFLRYVLVSNEYQSRLLALASAGATRPALTKTMIEELDIPSPPLAEQKAIAAVLGALDDKIELNRRMNATLEAMARALFQSWFVDYDPVRAKLDGRQPLGLAPDTAALFPHRLQDSPIGHIPKGWRACTLGDIAKNVSITFDFKRTPEVVFINTGDVLEGDFLHSKRSAQAGLPGQAKKSIRPDDILFSEIRPANKRYAYVDFDSSDYVVSTKFMIIRGSKEIHPRLLYRVLTAKETLDEFQVQAESRSGTFPQITFDSISHLPIVLPPIEIQEAFQRAVGKMDAQIKTNKQQSRTLATLRDTLLPKLLSGGLNVAEAVAKIATVQVRGE